MKLITIQEAAKKIQYSKQGVWYLIKSGKIKEHKVEAKIITMVDEEELLKIKKP